jgi:PrcB C-terminal
MLRMKESISVVLILMGMQGMGAGGCGTKQGNSGTVNVNTTARPTPTQGRVEEPVKGEITVLAEGAYGKITDTFVVVARDAETYAALREFAMNSLPDLSADYFRTNIVVAAFLGRRNTGGYSVQIRRVADNRLRVSSASPPKDAMTTQALTAPFKIVSVAVDENRSFAVELEPLWTNEMRPFRLTSGDFTTGGGFAGRFEKLQLAGDIRISRLGPLATLVFDLKGTGGRKERLLQNVATGLVAAGGELGNAVVDAGSLVDFPRSPLGLKGSFGANEDKLSLKFESLPSNVNDGYGGQGKLEATATAPPPKKRPANDDGPM